MESSRIAMRIVMLLVVAIIAEPALGQGRGMPLIPDPITTRELREYSDVLGLSDQQRMALFEMHDQHMQRYREMQDRDVTRLINQLFDVGMRFMGGNFAFPTREEVRKLSGDYRSILDKAKGMDREFFDGLAPLLSEAQIMRLEAVRLQREMRLYEDLLVNAVRELNPGAVVDLASLVADLEIAPEERDQVEPILAMYQSSRLRQMRQGIDLVEDAIMAAVDIIDEYGLREMSMEQMMELGQQPEFIDEMRARFDSLSAPFQRAAHEASQRNVQTHRQIALLLSQRNAWQLRDQYYRQAYRRAYSGPGNWRGRYNAALRVLELPNELRQSIAAQRDHFDRSDATLVNEMAAELEKSRAFRTVAQFEGRARTSAEEKLSDYQARRSALHNSANELLDGLLGPELVTALERERRAEREREQEAEQEQQQQVEIAISTQGASIASTLTAFDRQSQPDDAFMPYPMTAQDMAMLQAFLDIKSGQQEVVSVVFDTYRERYERLRTARRDAESDEVEAGQSDSETPVQQIRRKREAFDSLSQADQEFFDDLGLLIGEEEAARYVRWIKGLRQRQAASTLARGIAPSWGQQESYVDLVGLMLQHTSASTLPASVDSIVEEYDARLQRLVADRAESATEVHRYAMSMRRAHESGEAPQAVIASLSGKREEAMRKLGQINREIVSINRQSLDRLLDVFDEDDAWMMRWEYYKVAYPEIFDEASSAQRYFDAVLNMSDLDGYQRERIRDQMLHYRQRYFEVSDRMVTLRQARGLDFSGFQMPSRDDIQREVQLEQLRFDRAELANRAKYQLQLILREEQVSRIPDLRNLQ